MDNDLTLVSRNAIKLMNMDFTDILNMTKIELMKFNQEPIHNAGNCDEIRLRISIKTQEVLLIGKDNATI